MKNIMFIVSTDLWYYFRPTINVISNKNPYDMIEDIVNGTIILEGGYKVLTKDEVRKIIKASM